MPVAQTEINFDIPLDRVWDFFSDLKEVGSSLRFVGEIEPLKEGAIRWRVKFPMSKTTRTSFVDALYTEKRDREFLAWTAKGEHLQWSGRVKLESSGASQTKAQIALEIQGLGPMASVINPVASLQIRNQLKFFIEQVKGRLEGEK